MIYKNEQFTVDLKESIAELERKLQNTCTSLLKKYQLLYAKRNLLFEIELTREGNNPFEPGYNSSITFAVSDKEGGINEFQRIPVWECQRTFLGLPVRRNLPGSRVFGKLVDESLDEIKSELEDYLKELQEEKSKLI